MNPLLQLGDHGQSVWLDYIRRSAITGGDFARMIEEDGLKGVTSNPAIFEKAISGSTDYAEALRHLAAQKDLAGLAIFERLAIEDIQLTADLFAPVFHSTERRDGLRRGGEQLPAAGG